MSSRITIAAVVALLLGVGAWNALRPGAAESEPPAVAQERLASIPKQLGPWIGADNEINPKAMRIAEAEAYLSRTYRNGNEAFSVMVLYGTPGGLGAHDPQTCYAGTGFEQKGSAAQYSSNAGGSLWNARFERDRPTNAALDVYWGWGTRGNWQAPDQPRLAFNGESRIYKIYLQRAVPVGTIDKGTEMGGRFFDSFLDAVRTELMKPRT